MNQLLKAATKLPSNSRKAKQGEKDDDTGKDETNKSGTDRLKEALAPTFENYIKQYLLKKRGEKEQLTRLSHFILQNLPMWHQMCSNSTFTEIGSFQTVSQFIYQTIRDQCGKIFTKIESRITFRHARVIIGSVLRLFIHELMKISYWKEKELRYWRTHDINDRKIKESLLQRLQKKKHAMDLIIKQYGYSDKIFYYLSKKSPQDLLICLKQSDPNYYAARQEAIEILAYSIYVHEQPTEAYRSKPNLGLPPQPLQPMVSGSEEDETDNSGGTNNPSSEMFWKSFLISHQQIAIKQIQRNSINGNLNSTTTAQDSDEMMIGSDDAGAITDKTNFNSDKISQGQGQSTTSNFFDNILYHTNVHVTKLLRSPLFVQTTASSDLPKATSNALTEADPVTIDNNEEAIDDVMDEEVVADVVDDSVIDDVVVDINVDDAAHDIPACDDIIDDDRSLSSADTLEHCNKTETMIESHDDKVIDHSNMEITPITEEVTPIVEEIQQTENNKRKAEEVNNLITLEDDPVVKQPKLNHNAIASSTVANTTNAQAGYAGMMPNAMSSSSKPPLLTIGGGSSTTVSSAELTAFKRSLVGHYCLTNEQWLHVHNDILSKNELLMNLTIEFTKILFNEKTTFINKLLHKPTNNSMNNIWGLSVKELNKHLLKLKSNEQLIDKQFLYLKFFIGNKLFNILDGKKDDGGSAQNVPQVEVVPQSSQDTVHSNDVTMTTLKRVSTGEKKRQRKKSIGSQDGKTDETTNINETEDEVIGKSESSTTLPQPLQQTKQPTIDDSSNSNNSSNSSSDNDKSLLKRLQSITTDISSSSLLSQTIIHRRFYHTRTLCNKYSLSIPLLTQLIPELMAIISAFKYIFNGNEIIGLSLVRCSVLPNGCSTPPTTIGGTTGVPSTTTTTSIGVDRVDSNDSISNTTDNNSIEMEYEIDYYDHMTGINAIMQNIQNDNITTKHMAKDVNDTSQGITSIDAAMNSQPSVDVLPVLLPIPSSLIDDLNTILPYKTSLQGNIDSSNIDSSYTGSSNTDSTMSGVSLPLILSNKSTVLIEDRIYRKYIKDIRDIWHTMMFGHRNMSYTVIVAIQSNTRVILGDNMLPETHSTIGIVQEGDVIVKEEGGGILITSNGNTEVIAIGDEIILDCGEILIISGNLKYYHYHIVDRDSSSDSSNDSDDDNYRLVFHVESLCWPLHMTVV